MGERKPWKGPPAILQYLRETNFNRSAKTTSRSGILNLVIVRRMPSVVNPTLRSSRTNSCGRKWCSTQFTNRASPVRRACVVSILMKELIQSSAVKKNAVSSRLFNNRKFRLPTILERTKTIRSSLEFVESVIPLHNSSFMGFHVHPS